MTLPSEEEQRPWSSDRTSESRKNFSVRDSIDYIWTELGLPKDALNALDLVDTGQYYSSSFKVDHLAHVAIALSALSASLFWSVRTKSILPRVLVKKEHACAEFISERLYRLNGQCLDSPFNAIGGLHKTSDGHVRMHDGFPHHRANALKILGLPEDANRDEVAIKMLEWKSVDLESAAFEKEAVIVALRSFEEWDNHPQSRAVPKFPITLRRIPTKTAPIPRFSESDLPSSCLQGIRVVELSRVIAAPVAGRTLAAHGADVIWVTSPTLPNQPELDIDTARGKRTVQLDIKKSEDKAKLLELIQTADVFLSSYRPGSLAAQGFSTAELTKLNPNLIIASLNAWGEEGPWARNRGFDSLVQTASGINVAEAKRYGQGEPARVLPCQALDHGSGYLLATGIIAALYSRAIRGGAYEVHVALAGVMKYLRSLGPMPQEGAFVRGDFPNPVNLEKFMETRESGLGNLRAIRHSASVDGLEVGYKTMPKPLGGDEPVWLEPIKST